MNRDSSQGGQALILIVFAIVGLVSLTGLAVDGGMAYSDRRNAQNVADNSALAAALAYTRDRDPAATARASAANGGFDDNGASNSVSVTVADLPSGVCPNMALGKDITVQITSHVRTYFAPVIGILQTTNTVRATARSCDPYAGPMFPGNAIVALAPSGTGFDAAGTPEWLVEHGGIFSNSSNSPSARCKGDSDVTAPSLTAVGSVLPQCAADIALTTTGASQYQYEDYESLLPRVPACDGHATHSGNLWLAQPNADGSQVAFNGDMHFGPGLFCVTNSPGPFHGQISGNWVTFYLMPSDFEMKFNGGGNLTATAPTAGEFAGILMFSAPQLSGGALQGTQAIDFRGNGSGDVIGSVILPSADITMFGNSNSNGYKTQVIGYHVDSGGNSDIHINYNAGLSYQASHPAWLTLLR